MNLQTGDIILTSKKSIIARFMGVFQKDQCIWGHILVAKDNDTAWEAHWTMREVELSEVFKKKKYWKIIRKKDLTEKQKEIMLKVAQQLLGKFYSVWRIILQLLDHIFHTDKFSGSDHNQYAQVCSSFAAWIYEISCRYKFNGIGWESCDPDDIEDDQLAHPETWEILGEKSLRRK
jgi:hypothetical protein